MDVHVRVDIDEDGPVVVKSGTGPAVDRLRHEHERLVRAVHPGVVALARQPSGPAPSDPAPGDVRPTDTGDPAGAGPTDDADGYVLRTRYAGEPVSRWTGTVRDVAGLGAAVAATLADLHALGIVHGRLDRDHILLGDDGRPRLCGLSHRGVAEPADDVAALGTVLGDLLARAPAGRRRRTRGSSAAARALRQVIDRATDPLPTRRPSAGALADAVLAAVPDADLPTPAGRPGRSQPGAHDDDGPAGTGAAVSGRRAATQPDTLDRIWSFAGEQSDDERWAAAFGPGPRDLPDAGAESGPRPVADRRGGENDEGTPRHRPEAPPTLPMARVETSAWSPTADRHIPPIDEPAPAAGGRGWGRHDDRPRQDHAPDPDRVAHPHVGPGEDSTRGTRAPAPRRQLTHRDGDELDRGDPGRLLPRRGPAGNGVTDPGGSGDDGRGWPVLDDEWPDDPHVADRWGDETTGGMLTRDHHVPVPRVTRPHGAGGDDGPGPRGGGRWLVVTGAVAAAGLAVAGAAIVGVAGDADDPSGSEATAPAGDCPPAAEPAADVDGDGCAEALVVDGSTVDAGVARWSLGEPGDLVTVGDWDCDGEASAALLRPATGDVFVFTAWAPTDEPVTVGASQQVAGGVGIRAEPAGRDCDRLLVDRTDGTSATVEVPR